MRIRALHLFTLTACTSLAACDGSGPFGPIDPSEISIELGVSGGFIGVAYSFRIDGETLEVRGVTCSSFCDFQPGELIVTISEAQLTEIVRRLEEAEVFERAGDYGSECCDQIYLGLTYTRGSRVARVEGTTQAIPPTLQQAMSYMVPLASGSLPTLVSPETSDEDWPRDAYSLGDVTVNGFELRADVTYGGGCAGHAMDLVAVGGWMESSPVQINGLITHDDGDDPCDAVVTEERVFDLSPLARAFRLAYGDPFAPVTVVLRLWDPDTGTRRQIDLEF